MKKDKRLWKVPGLFAGALPQPFCMQNQGAARPAFFVKKSGKIPIFFTEYTQVTELL
ncbi:hypothetical protein [Acidaminococcus timonensis]|uniref:hypothetical protein n=1 Tax=Acidaminococcus timonensis TaxID=1871002 RepID=UPI002942BDAA|nr:hypothetical protein [Acidaminococcus timonensis]